MLSAIFYGLRISIQIGLAAGFVSLTIGTTLGILAAYVGGRVEALIMRLVDLQLSFPAILLALVIVALLGQGKAQLIGALVAAQYAYFARTAYGAAKAERGKDYIEAALATPLSARLVVLRHLLPNCTPPLIVVATVQIANSISLEATLSFLGARPARDGTFAGHADLERLSLYDERALLDFRLSRCRADHSDRCDQYRRRSGARTSSTRGCANDRSRSERQKPQRPISSPARVW